MTIAAISPKTVFRGTAISTLWVVSHRAWTAVGFEIAVQKAPGAPTGVISAP